MSVTAIVMSHDDVVLAELSLPYRRPFVEWALPSKPMTQIAEERLLYGESHVTIRTVRFWIDATDSVAHQLANNNPDVWVYRQRNT